MAFILSKLANSQCYTKWATGPNGINQLVAEVKINGGADVINKKTLDTPNGVVTEVSDNDLDLLKQNHDFLQHLEKGYLTIIDSRISDDKAQEKAAAMTKDKSRQKTPKDFKRTKKVKPVDEE